MANSQGNTPSGHGPNVLQGVGIKPPDPKAKPGRGPKYSSSGKVRPGDGVGGFIQFIGWVVVGLAGLGLLAGLNNMSSYYSSDDAPVQIGLAVAAIIQGFLLVGFGRLISLTGDLKFAAQRSSAYLNQGARDKQIVSILEELKASAQRSENYLAQAVKDLG